MALGLDDPLVWGVVFVLVLVVEVLVAMNLKSRTAAGDRYERPSREAQLDEGEDLTDILSRFVESSDGARIGETVGMDGDMVIVKSLEKAEYKAVPKTALTRSGETYKVTGTVDWAEAEAQGTAWREKQHKVVEYGTDELPEDERDRPY